MSVALFCQASFNQEQSQRIKYTTQKLSQIKCQVHEKLVKDPVP